MSTSPESAFVLTGIYVAVHLINAVAADVAVSASLVQGAEGKVTLQPLVRQDDVVRLDGSWFTGRRCRLPTDAIAVRLGDTVLRVPRAEVAEMAVDKSVVREQNGSGWIRMAGSVGCPENPLPGRFVSLNSTGANVAGMMVWASPDDPRQISDVHRRLNSTRSQADCETWGGLRSCPIDQFGTRRVRILFGDRQQTMASGLPLHAVCTVTDTSRACEITESQSTGIGYRAFLRRAGDSADLVAAESDVRARLDAYIQHPVQLRAEATL